MLRTKALYVVSALVLAIFSTYLIIFAYNYSTLSDILSILIVVVVDVVFFSWYFLPENNVYRSFSDMVLTFVAPSLLVAGIVMRNLHSFAIALIMFSAVASHLLSVSRYDPIVLFEIVASLIPLYIIKNRFGYYLTFLSIFVLNYFILLRFTAKILKISMREAFHLFKEQFEDLIRQPTSKAFTYLIVLTPLIVTIILVLNEAEIPLSDREVGMIIALVGSVLLTLCLGLKMQQCSIDIFQFGVFGMISLIWSSIISELRKELQMMRTSRSGHGSGVVRALRILLMSIYSIAAIGITLASVVIIIFVLYLVLQLNVIASLTVTVSIILSIFTLFLYVLVFLYRNPQYISELANEGTPTLLILFAIMIILLTIFIHTPLICGIQSKSIKKFQK